MFTFYDFPADHWAHIRTTNPIESTFATVRHRTRQTKGCGNRIATLTMVFKLRDCFELKGEMIFCCVFLKIAFIANSYPIYSKGFAIKVIFRKTSEKAASLQLETVPLTRVAESGWRRLRGFALLSKVVGGIKFKDGEEITGKENVA